MSIQSFYGEYFFSNPVYILLGLELAGFLLLYFGRKLEKLGWALIGFFSGYYFADRYLYEIFNQATNIKMDILVFNLIIAIISIIIILLIRKISLVLLGIILGYWIAFIFLSFDILPPAWYIWVICIIIGIILALSLYKGFIILASSLAGSILIFFSTIALITIITSNSVGSILDQEILCVIIISILTIIGIYSQNKRRR